MSDLSASNPMLGRATAGNNLAGNLDRPLFNFPREKAKGLFEGLGYHGSPLNLKDNDPESRKPKLEYKAHVRQFNLDNPTDMADYEKVCQAAFDGDVLVSYEKIVYDEKISSWHVLLRWAEQFYTTPPEIDTSRPK